MIAALARPNAETIALWRELPILSIRQPWAWLIANGWKDIENRTWWTSQRGRFLIHAGLRAELEAIEDLRAGRHPVTGERMQRMDLPAAFDCGGIVGIATVTDCLDASPSPWFVGPYGFVIQDAEPVPFLPLPGALSFFRSTFSPAELEYGEQRAQEMAAAAAAREVRAARKASAKIAGDTSDLFG